MLWDLDNQLYIQGNVILCELNSLKYLKARPHLEV